MKFDKNVFENCLWESYSIDVRKQLRKKIRAASDSEKLVYNKHFTLNNMFLIRRFQDPGFHNHVLHMVSQDPEIVELVKKYIQKLFYEFVDNIDASLFKLSPDDNVNTENTISGNYQNPFENQEDPIKLLDNLRAESAKTQAMSQKNAQSYLSMRLENAIKEEDEDEVQAIQSLKNDYATHRFFLQTLFSEDPLYTGFDNTNTWTFSHSRYVRENLKCIDLYGKELTISPTGIDRVFHQLCDMDELIVNQIIELASQLEYGKPESNLKLGVAYNKLINDAVSIASYIWFNKHSEDEKIQILNGVYDFDISEQKLSDMMKSEQFAIYFAQQFFLKYYYAISEKIYRRILSSTQNEIHKYHSADGVACCLREQRKFEEAIPYFQEAAQWSEKQAEKPGYKKAVCLKNVGEMYGHLKDLPMQDKFFSLAMRVPNLSQLEYLQVLWNISVAYRRLGQYDNEYSTLENIVNNPLVDNLRTNEYEGLVANVHGRLYMIDCLRAPEQCFKIRENLLKEWDNKEKLEELNTKGLSLYKSFQFKKAIDFYDNAYKISGGEAYLAHQVLTFLAMDDLDGAKRLIKQLLELDTEYPPAYYYQVLIHLREDDYTPALDCFRKAISLNEMQNYYPDFIGLLVNELIVRHKDSRFLEVLETIYAQQTGHDSFYWHVGDKYREWGFIEKSIECYTKLAKKYDSPANRFNAKMNSGLSYYLNGAYDNAINEIEAAVKINGKNAKAWALLSKANGDSLRMKRAIVCVNNAIDLSQGEEKQLYVGQRELYEKFSGEIINIQDVADEDIKNILTTAEKIVLKSKMMNDKTIDFSMVIMYYGKALEKMLDIHITEPMRADILRQLGGKIPEKYYKGINEDGRYILGLPFPLKNALGINKKNITLGQWARLSQDIKQSISNPVVKKVDDYICTNHAAKIRAVYDTCYDLADLRNELTHSEVTNWDDMMSARRNVIDQINIIIEKIYSKQPCGENKQP